MPVLKSLSFTTTSKSSFDPVHLRRARFVQKLEEQKLLIQKIRTIFGLYSGGSP
jgi:hypothetical protein